MTSSLQGSRGPAQDYSKLRGVDPRMKGISGHNKFSQFTPEQLELFQSLFSHLGPDSFLSQLASGDEATFNQIEAPALRQFAELQGGLASRFSMGGGKGSLGSRHSSGFQNAQNQAASNFAQQLQAQRSGLQRQAVQDLMGNAQMLFGQQPFGLQQKPERQQGGWGGLIGGGLGALGGALVGGPSGALQGAQLGYGVGSAF